MYKSMRYIAPTIFYTPTYEQSNNIRKNDYLTLQMSVKWEKESSMPMSSVFKD